MPFIGSTGSRVISILLLEQGEAASCFSCVNLLVNHGEVVLFWAVAETARRYIGKIALLINYFLSFAPLQCYIFNLLL
jgi:hypothetical protein